MAENWDNLIILDACRTDLFSEINTIPGKFETAISKASQSEGFIQENFAGGEFHDTIYVTANPFANDLSDDVFYKKEMAADYWDYELNTVSPSDMVGLALDVHEKHPNKRLIVHFMQPHEPHLGETAEEIRNRIDIRGYDIFHASEDRDLDRDGINSWTAAERGLVSDSELREAYKQTLEIVLTEVETLVEELDGKSVLTADHGEMLGERILSLKKCYGHPSGLKTPELRKVPWFTVQHEERRTITAEAPQSTERLDEREVDERLQALGYK